MTPFEQLRRSDGPIAPSARFAHLLRTRVEAALAVPPTSADIPSIRLPDRSTTMTSSVVPYLCVADASSAMRWYADVLGATETVRYTGDDGRIGHAELSIGGATIMLSDPYPDSGVDAPGTSLPSVSMNLTVDDVDAVFGRAVARGAVVQREPADQPYGERSCTIVDPFGHRWMIQTPVATPTLAEIDERMDGFTVVAGEGASAPVELGYLTIGTVDTAVASRFYGALFGWTTEPGNAGDGYAHIANTRLPMGFTPDGSETAPVLYFRVPDAAASARRVVELGGTVVGEASYESGGDVVCRDDQGREFHLWQPAPGY
ncbi:MAG: VOC family protein [Acidimicrobiales bacterium]